LSIRAARPGQVAPAAGAAKTSGTAANASASLHDFINALRDGFPLGVVFNLKLLAQTLGYALAHLLRIEVPRQGSILGLGVARADNQPGGCSQRAGHD